MALDITINPLAINLAKSEHASTHAQIVVLTGVDMPIEDPNTGGPLRLPVDQYRIPVDKQAAKQLGEALIQLSEDLDEPSKIQLASSLDGVDKAAAQSRALRG